MPSAKLNIRLQEYTSYKVLIIVLLGICTNNIEEILSSNKVKTREPCLIKSPVSHSIRQLLKFVNIENVQYLMEFIWSSGKLPFVGGLVRTKVHTRRDVCLFVYLFQQNMVS